MIVYKSPREIDVMREAGRVARLALDAACAMVRPGVSTAEIDAEVERVIRAHGATPEFKGYHGYPASTCISVNDQVVHGIPGTRRLKDGDVVGIDVGARLKGYVGDNAATVCVGKVGEKARLLVDTTRECLERAVRECVPGRRLSDIGRAVQAHAEARGFSLVREYAGHGIGTRMHEDPQVPNYVDDATLRRDLVLREGLCIAIEPMLNAGRADVYTLDDDWTVVTKDGSLSAHWEDTVAVTKDGPVVLTRA
ncbi:MAG: type I methionyl aminopeptidase [Planctomycetes bacterium]|nr:type I methionyl aminopeptidase [Planctomycetota bacterium]